MAMIEVRQTAEFSRWLRRQRDANAVARIVARIRRMEQGNLGDSKSLGAGLMEMRVDYGPGLRRLLCAPWSDDRDPVVCWRQAHAAARHQTGSGPYGETVMLKTTRFEAADYLDSEKKQAAYITAALETGDAAFVRDALGIVAKARGMGQVAKTADLNRESLYKALGETGNPEFGTVMRVMRALGLTLAAHPAERKRAPKKRRAA
jgi:probable addiction module antidote protein